MPKEFMHKIKVYYEDTDAGGVVYYANYLKYLERARTEFLHSFGITNKLLIDEHGVLIIVKSCHIEYLKPAKLEDNLEITSQVKSLSKTSFVMFQKIKKDNILISSANLHLVIVSKNGKPSKIPEILIKHLQ